MIRLVCGALVLAATAGGAFAQEQEDRYAQARLACMADVIRLCPDKMLDPAEARACMKDKHALVSPGCAAFYPGGKRANEVR